MTVMRIDNAYSENRIHYPWGSSLPAFSPEEDATDKAPAFPEEKSTLPVVYKRYDPRRKDYIVKLSSADVQISDEEKPVLQGVFAMDARQANEMEYRFSSWTKTVSSILGREIKKGIYINRFV
jgi:hypothetical protein